MANKPLVEEYDALVIGAGWVCVRDPCSCQKFLTFFWRNCESRFLEICNKQIFSYFLFCIAHFIFVTCDYLESKFFDVKIFLSIFLNIFKMYSAFWTRNWIASLSRTQWVGCCNFSSTQRFEGSGGWREGCSGWCCENWSLYYLLYQILFFSFLFGGLNFTIFFTVFNV
jgi:hypothetical protein